jgi:hypothetical protein
LSSSSHTDSDWRQSLIADMYNPEHTHTNMNAVREKITILIFKAK